MVLCMAFFIKKQVRYKKIRQNVFLTDFFIYIIRHCYITLLDLCYKHNLNFCYAHIVQIRISQKSPVEICLGHESNKCLAIFKSVSRGKYKSQKKL